MIAIGAYLRALRKEQSITQKSIAEALRTSASQLNRVEDGEQEPRLSQLMQWLDLVSGSPLDLLRLIQQPNATAEDGERLAREWLDLPESQRLAILELALATINQSDDEVAALFRDMREVITQDQGIRQYLRGLLDGLKRRRV